MVGTLVVILLLLAIHRELLALWIWLQTGARKAEAGSWDILLKAHRRTCPRVFLFDRPFVESISMNCLWGSYVFVERKLWESWDDSEREAYLCWVHSAHLHASTIERLFLGGHVFFVDRDVGLLGANSLALTRALEKTWAHRAQFTPSAFAQIFTGLSFLGPSLLAEWPDHQERLKSMIRYLEKLHS